MYMALSIEDPETDRLARELAQTTSGSLTDAIKRALEERLPRERAMVSSHGLTAAILRSTRHGADIRLAARETGEQALIESRAHHDVSARWSPCGASRGRLPFEPILDVQPLRVHITISATPSVGSRRSSCQEVQLP